MGWGQTDIVMQCLTGCVTLFEVTIRKKKLRTCCGWGRWLLKTRRGAAVNEGVFLLKVAGLDGGYLKERWSEIHQRCSFRTRAGGRKGGGVGSAGQIFSRPLLFEFVGSSGIYWSQHCRTDPLHPTPPLEPAPTPQLLCPPAALHSTATKGTNGNRHTPV